MDTLAVDIGGTGIKVMVLDASGKSITERERLETPHPATPDAVVAIIMELASRMPRFDRISVGFPGVVRQGVIDTAANLDSSWIGVDLASLLEKKLTRPVRVANDADVQGFAAITGKGVELVLTLGTGLGSALFVETLLVPNLEVAHHRFRGKDTYEERLGNAALERDGRKHWNKQLLKAIAELKSLFNYDSLYLGGGNAKKVEGNLPPNVTIVPNVAGLLGGIALWREHHMD
jgi:polyphosphate glucokinase